MTSLLLFLLAGPRLIPAAQAVEPEESWSLEEKVGQMLWPVLDERNSKNLEEAARGGLFGGGLLRWDMPRSEAKLLIRRLRRAANQTKGGRPLIAVDHEGGSLFTQESLQVPVFSGNMALGAAGSPGLAEKAAAVVGRELRSIGVDVNFAPVVDVNSNPANPIIGIRSFGEDPLAVAALGAAAVRGYLRGGVLPAVKHFPGHGDTAVDSHSSLPVILRERKDWDAVDLPPFRSAIGQHAPIVMTAHISAPALGTGDLPVTFSSSVLVGVLRGELDFEGVIVSDSLDMGAVKGRFAGENAAVKAVNAGCDVLLIGRAPVSEVHDGLVRAVQEGKISKERIDQAWRRILGLKRRALTMRPGPKSDWRDLETKIAEKSVTVLRNDGSVLPLNREKKDGKLLVLAFPHRRFGPASELLAAELRARRWDTEFKTLKPGSEDYSENIMKEAGDSHAVILVIYGWNRVRDVKMDEYIRKLTALKTPVIVVSALNPYNAPDYPEAKSVVLTYSAAPASMRAAARVLFGEIVPVGRTPVTISGRFPLGSGGKY